MSEMLLKKNENEMARLRIRIEEKERFIERQKKDFDNIFEELKKLKKDETNSQFQGGSGMRNSASMPYIPVESNPYVIKEFNKKI